MGKGDALEAIDLLNRYSTPGYGKDLLYTIGLSVAPLLLVLFGVGQFPGGSDFIKQVIMIVSAFCSLGIVVLILLAEPAKLPSQITYPTALVEEGSLPEGSEVAFFTPYASENDRFRLRVRIPDEGAFEFGGDPKTTRNTVTWIKSLDEDENVEPTRLLNKYKKAPANKANIDLERYEEAILRRGDMWNRYLDEY